MVDMFVRKVNDMEIPVLGLGTWEMKGETCKKAVKSALEMGYRHVDTAAVYKNEKVVGKVIEESDVDREDIFLTTKIMLSDSRKKWRKSQANGDVIERANKCLERLATDYVDLLLIHWPDPKIPIEDSLDAMEKLKEEGKIRHIGVSNFTVELLEEALKANPGVACNQVEMHPFLQQKDMLEYCQENNIILTAYSPLARGKVMKNGLLKEIGEKYGKTPAQVSLRWLIQKDNVVAIPKSSKKKHMHENMLSLNFHLENGDVEKIDGIKERCRCVDPEFAPW